MDGMVEKKRLLAVLNKFMYKYMFLDYVLNITRVLEKFSKFTTRFIAELT